MMARSDAVAVLGPWLMYLRKSRQDDPNETVEQVLAKHEAILQEYAARELGGRIPEACIFREVVSGETIADRAEIQKVLQLIERPEIKGVLVVEPQRLSRGDLADCGRLINAFRFSGTQVLTPVMAYDLGNKMERKFFQDELLRGRDFLEYTKEILLRGRVASVKRGNYIQSTPPYGYERIREGKDWTLRPVPVQAATVQEIFALYADQGLSPGSIATHLNRQGLPSPTGKTWGTNQIKKMLVNVVYTGRTVYFRYRQTPTLRDGEIRQRRTRSDPEEQILAEGKHPAIISEELFARVQQRMALQRAASDSTRRDRAPRNPFTGVLRCAVCGHVLDLKSRKGARDRYACRLGCTRSIPAEDVAAAVLAALELSELPELEARTSNTAEREREALRARVTALEAQLAELHAMEARQYDFLESGRYSPETFDARHAVIRERISAAEAALMDARAAVPMPIDYQERVVSLRRAIEALKDGSVPVPDKNRLLRAIVERVSLSTPTPQGDGKGHRLPTEGAFALEIALRL